MNQKVDLERLIGSYTVKWTKRFISEGYEPDEDEVRSDISFAVANSIRGFNSNQQTTKFTTYAITSIRNAMRSYRKRMQREINTLPFVEYAGLVCQKPAQEGLVKISDLLRNLKGVDKVIAYVIIYPSSRVLELVAAYEARRDMIDRCNYEEHSSSLLVAISIALNISESRVNKAVFRIRAKIKEIL